LYYRTMKMNEIYDTSGVLSYYRTMKINEIFDTSGFYRTIIP
jgi:hypothetical protein